MIPRPTRPQAPKKAKTHEMEARTAGIERNERSDEGRRQNKQCCWDWRRCRWQRGDEAANRLPERRRGLHGRRRATARQLPQLSSELQRDDFNDGSGNNIIPGSTNVNTCC
jgi:hypothetical protein